MAGQGTYTLDARHARMSFAPVFGFAGHARGVTYRVTDAYGQSATGTFAPTVRGPATPTPHDRVSHAGEPHDRSTAESLTDAVSVEPAEPVGPAEPAPDGLAEPESPGAAAPSAALESAGSNVSLPRVVGIALLASGVAIAVGARRQLAATVAVALSRLRGLDPPAGSDRPTGGPR